MSVVWKFPLAPVTEQAVVMPAGAEILHVDEQDGRVCLWALVDPDASLVEKLISIRGTGEPIDAEWKGPRHIGTVLTAGGQLVWHVFAILESEPS